MPPTYRPVQIHLHLHTRANRRKPVLGYSHFSFLLILANVLILMLSTEFNKEGYSKHFNADVKDCLSHKLSGSLFLELCNSNGLWCDSLPERSVLLQPGLSHTGPQTESVPAYRPLIMQPDSAITETEPIASRILKSRTHRILITRV